MSKKRTDEWDFLAEFDEEPEEMLRKIFAEPLPQRTEAGAKVADISDHPAWGGKHD